VPLGDEAIEDLQADLALGPPDEGTRGNGLEDAVGGMRGAPQQRDLVGVLGHSQVAKDLGRESERPPRQRALEREHMHRPEVGADEDPPTESREPIRHEAVRVLCLIPRHDLDEAFGRSGARRGGHRLEPRRDEDRPDRRTGGQAS